jgi:hypothetical protein
MMPRARTAEKIAFIGFSPDVIAGIPACWWEDERYGHTLSE